MAIDLDLLNRACAAVNAEPDFKKLGTADVAAGIKSGDDAFLVRFEAFECAGVERIEVEQLRDADFHLDLDPKDWQLYLLGRKAGKAPSLSALDIATDGGIVRGSDPLKTLKFERYLGTLQAFVDTAARL